MSDVQLRLDMPTLAQRSLAKCAPAAENVQGFYGFVLADEQAHSIYWSQAVKAVLDVLTETGFVDLEKTA